MKGNYDAEIKKGMQAKPKAKAVAKPQQKNAASSTNDAPGNKPPANTGMTNKVPMPTPQGGPQNMAQAAAPVDTAQMMHEAGQAHMAAIHAHINSMKG